MTEHDATEAAYKRGYEDGRNEIPAELQTAIKAVIAEYEAAKTHAYIRKPICYALYHAWRRMDRRADK